MEQIEGQRFFEAIVRLDGKCFMNCDFQDCLLSYGGEPCEWDNTRFSNCRVILDGKAIQTIQTLRGLGFEIAPPDGAQAQQRVHSELRPGSTSTSTWSRMPPSNQ